MATTRVCAAPDCTRRFPVNGKQKYHDPKCRQRTSARNRRAELAAARKDPTQVRRGGPYQLIKDLGMWDLFAEGTLSAEGVRGLLAERGYEFSGNAVSTALNAMRIDARLDSVSQGWAMDTEVREMLALDHPPPSLDDIEADPAVLEEWLDRAVEGFVAFRHRFFRHKRGGYITKGFHRRWIRAILRAIVTGGKQMILSPPRHGKSELLQHFCVWLICRDPEISILWIAKRLTVAAQTTGAVKAHLEHNTKLIEAVCPPNRRFAPANRHGSSGWTDAEFTVANRITIGQKSPTMMAIGRGSSILSLDVDFIVQDDIEDKKSTDSETERAKTKGWDLQDLDSRKEEHTGWLHIGSRVHPEDLAGDRLDDDEWSCIVDQAHDPTCPLDPDDDGAHVDCMLFPEIRSYRWLRKKWRSFVSMGLEHLFHMIYQNDPQPPGVVFYTRDLIAKAHDTSRGLGIPEGKRETWRQYLVAGLDPAATRQQAAFCWAVEFEVLPINDPFGRTDQGRGGYQIATTINMVDCDDRTGGGVDAFIDGPGETWRRAYGLRHWVVEENLVKVDFFDHPRMLRWVQAHNIILEPHSTQANKTDPNFGIGSMRYLYQSLPTGIQVDSADTRPRKLSLPYGDPDARAKVEGYTKQLVRFTDETMQKRKARTDLVDASWFPMKVVRRWEAEFAAIVEFQADDAAGLESGMGVDYEVSEYDLGVWR